MGRAHAGTHGAATTRSLTYGRCFAAPDDQALSTALGQ